MRDDDPDYAAALRRRLGSLREKLKEGKFIFNRDSVIEEGLAAIRTGADGEIDLSSVSGPIRALALAAEALHEREETKSVISLLDLQRAYFKFIDAHFGKMYADMRENGLSPYQIASGLARDEEAVANFYSAVPELLDWSKSVWKEAWDIAHIHAEDLAGLKAVFGGETFPQGYKNIVSSTGVYVDTVVLPDPFLRSQLELKGENKAHAVRAMIAAGLSLLNYHKAATAELETPLALIVPDATHFDEHARDTMLHLAEGDTVHHVNALFGRQFTNFEEATEYLRTLRTPENVERDLVDKSRFLFEENDKRSVAELLSNFMNLPFLRGMGVKHVGQAVLFSAQSRMAQARDLQLRSGRLGGVPIIDATTSWRYFNWSLAYGQGFSTDQHVSMHMAKALQSAAEGEMQWLGAVPVDALIEMRKVGALPELRQILSDGVKELVELRPDNFFRTGDKVVENIQRAFDNHRAQLAELRGKKWRFAGVELGSCVVKGVTKIASVWIPGINLVGDALDQIGTVPKFKELPGRVRQLRDDGKALRRSPVGMLFKVSESR